MIPTMVEDGSRLFERGEWLVELARNGHIYLHMPSGRARLDMLEVQAFDLRRALGDALDAIQRDNGRSLAEIEAVIPRGDGG